jgi:hypothetical protein
MSRSKSDAQLKPVLQTTIGDLSAALFEAALAELGNVQLARRVAAETLRDMLSRAHQAQLTQDLAPKVA